MGYCLYGNDIDETTSPIEAGLSWITKFNKEFTNSKYLLKEKENGTKRKLIGFETLERGIPRKAYNIMDNKDNIIGKVTSGTMSPSLNKGIGLGYVLTHNIKNDEFIYIEIRSKKIKSKIVKLPFK